MAVIYSNNYDGRQMSLTVTQSKGTSSQNYSTINWTLSVYGGNSMYYSTGPTDVVIDGVNRWHADRKAWNSYQFPAGTGSVSGSFIKYHNNDGTCGAIGFSLSTAIFTASVSSWGGSLPMESIPRYPSSNQSLASKTETSIKMNWSSDSTCDYVWYSKDNGSNWTAVGSVNGSSGSYTISGLSANNTYNIKTRVRRKDSQLTKDSDNSPIATYDWPKINSTPDFTIGNSLKIGIYNPLNRSVQVYIKGDNNSEKGGDSTTGDNITGYNNDSWKSFWYNSIPNKTGIDSNNKARYKVRLICSAVSRDITINGGYYRIKNDGTEIPTFSDSNWSYSANLTQLTNNNQVIIKDYSTITYTVNQAATSAFGATISKYVYKWGTKSKDSTSGNTVSNGENNVLEVSAVDSRGLIKTTSKTLASNVLYVPYLIPSLDYSSSYTHRTDGISTETKLTLRGNLSVMKFGSSGVANAIYSAKYKVYDPSNNTWSQEFNIPVNKFNLQESGYFTLNSFMIHKNGTSGGFPTGKRYAVQVIIKDGKGILGTFTSSNILITDGKIARDVYQDGEGNYHQGINGMADSNYTEKIYGNVNTTGNFIGNLIGNASTSTTATNATKWNNLVNDNSTLNNTDTWIPVISSGKMQHTVKDVWTSKTHSQYDTDQGRLITRSCLSFWNGAYNSSNSSNLTYAHEGTIQCKPTVLYDNSSGNTGDITLNQSSANFNYLEIYYKPTDYYPKQNVQSIKVNSPNGKYVNLFSIWISGNIRLIWRQVLITGANINTQENHNAFFTAGNTLSSDTKALTAIVKVVGYK